MRLLIGDVRECPVGVHAAAGDEEEWGLDGAKADLNDGLLGGPARQVSSGWVGRQRSGTRVEAFAPRRSRGTKAMKTWAIPQEGATSVSKRKRNRTLESSRVLLRTLEDLVDRERWSLDAAGLARWRDQPWAGADVVICHERPTGNPRGDTFVVTPYAGELSWLVDEIKQVCGEFLDFRNKFAFYGRLADAANHYHNSRSREVWNAKDLCFSVIREASRIVEEEQRGGFHDRDSVRLRGVDVHLFPDGGPAARHLAVFQHPTDAPVDLAGSVFVHRGKSWTMGPVTLRMGDGDTVSCVAGYREVDTPPDGGRRG